jgi:glycosyltransferase involved in cell wall biosynthesis
VVLYVDERWKGHHGIARFASQVVPRLHVPSQPIEGPSPLGLRALTSGLRLTAADDIYSPGFNASATRARQLLTIHDLIHLDSRDEASRAKQLYYNCVVKPAVLRAGIVHTVSEFSKSRIHEWLNSAGVSVVNVGNGVSDIFDAAGVCEPLAPRTFLYVGNVKPHKNAEVLFDALKLRPSYRLLLVTGDAYHAEQNALRAGVQHQVHTINGVSDERLASLYRATSGLLFPSLLEGFGLPPLEAIMSGASVAYSSQCAAVVEVVGAAGYAVAEPRSPEEWAHAMDALLEVRPTLNEHVWVELQRRYSWDAVGARVNSSLKGWSAK